MKIRVCHIISDLDQSVFVDAIGKFLDGEKYDLIFIFLGAMPPALCTIMGNKGHRVEYVELRSRKMLPRAIWELQALLRNIQPDVVHTHMVSASLAGLIAARITGFRNTVHTRHHSSECFEYYPHAVYYDKFINGMSKRIVAISHAVSDVLTMREFVDPIKIRVIEHGLDMEMIRADPDNSQRLLRKFDLTGKHPIIGVISRFVHWKGIQYIIPAFSALTRQYPNAKLVLANATGGYTSEIETLLKSTLKPSQYVLIPFEPKIFDLYKCFDVFVHVPITADFEAYGLIYVEALALEVPSVFTLSGIAAEFIKDRHNALVVPYCDSDSIYNAMLTLLSDRDLRDRIVAQGKADVLSLFTGQKMADKLDKLYSEMASE